MNRAEFMRRLTELLGDVAPTEREEAIQYYNDYFDDAGEENESTVIASLGTPEELAQSIKAGLNDGGNGGEFTEAGFSGYAQMPRDEIIRPEDVESAGRSYENGSNAGGAFAGGNRGDTYQDGAYQDGAGSGGQSGNGYYDGAYYKRPEGDGVYGGRQDTRNHRNPYEQSGFQGGGDTSYTSYGDASYGQTDARHASYGQAKAAKEPMSGGMIALIIVVAVLTSPVWLGLLGSLFGIAVGLIAALFGLFLAFLIVGVVFVVVAIALVITGIALLFSAPLGGLCVIGTGLALFAVGLVAIWVMVALAGVAIPALVRGIVSLCQRIFHRGGARA